MRKFSTHSVSATLLFKNFPHYAVFGSGFIQHDGPDRLRFLFCNNFFLFMLDENDTKI